MIDSLLVPDACLVENEFMVALGAAEDHLRIEHVHVPEEGRSTVLSIYFLQVLDVDVNASQLSKHLRLVENDLLRVRQQLRMEAEVVHLRKTSGQ